MRSKQPPLYMASGLPSRTVLSRLFVALLVCGWMTPSNAINSPARLTEGEQSIERLLRIPKDVPLGRYAVNCEAVIGKAGRAQTIYCYSPKVLPPRLADAVAVAARRARFTPATRDGVPTAVYMLFMVRVDVTASDPLILVVPNNGLEAAKYGLYYTAPQRFNEFYWSGGTVASRPWEGVRGVDSSPGVVWQKLRIDEHGEIVDYAVIDDYGVATKRTLSLIRNSIRRMEFMPGLFEGKPVSMDYLEPAFFDPDYR